MNKTLGQGEGSILIELSRPLELIFLTQKNMDAQALSLTQLDSDEHVSGKDKVFYKLAHMYFFFYR